MNYIIVNPEGILTSEQRARAISRELFNISVPSSIRAEDQVSDSVFGIIKHPSDNIYCLSVDLLYSIYVHPENNITDLVSLFPEVPQSEIDFIAEKIINSATGAILFSEIIPSTVTVRDYNYMLLNGWFTEEI